MSDHHLTQENSQDPLKRVETAQRALFEAYAKVSSGFSNEHVVGAALNLLVNALRQSHTKRIPAINRVDELAAEAKRILDSHYDSVSGERRNIFPFEQVVQMPHIDFKSKATKRN